MRLKIETSGSSSGWPVRPGRKQDYRDKDKQATTPDGRPIWAVRLTRSSTTERTSESIWVEVAGDKPELTCR